MSVACERYVSARFDAVESRFRPTVAENDVRLRAILSALGPLAGRRMLDLGCGKGRFARRFQEAGAEVVGLDVSAGMLREAVGIDRVRGSARRLPFASESFDAVVAVEVLEHVGAIPEVLAEMRRVLRPGGVVAIVDKNAGALDVNRPWVPSLLVKRLDEHRGLWMYPAGAPVRERWFWPGAFARRLRGEFESVRVSHLLTPREARRAVFRRFPQARLLTLWTGRRAGGDP
jgi:2-polyprenyl-6-hydroxyphenyl methylase/3-demethylubiquinone-9 3-methyltransferase